MTSLNNHHSGTIQKCFYLGDSGTGKTGSLVSLLSAGYKLRILDLDNGLDSLVSFARKECPDKISNVDYETVRDEIVAGPQGPIIKRPRAYLKSLSLMTEWSDGTKPCEWGPDTVFVVDSVTQLGRAAFHWAKGLNPTTKDPRQWYHAAQGAVENIIELLTSEAFKTNLILITHVNYVEGDDNLKKGYPNLIGSALSPKIGLYVNSIILAQTKGVGQNAKRVIRTAATNMIDLKNPAPFKFEAELPLETGLATFFNKLKEAPTTPKT